MRSGVTGSPAAAQASSVARIVQYVGDGPALDYGLDIHPADGARDVKRR